MKKTILALTIAMFASPALAYDPEVAVNISVLGAEVKGNGILGATALNVPILSGNNLIDDDVLKNQDGVSQVSQNTGINSVAQQSTNVNATINGDDDDLQVNAGILVASVSGNQMTSQHGLNIPVFSGNNVLTDNVLQNQR